MEQRISSRLVDSLIDVLSVRKLRNACCESMTDYRETINVLQQVHWYFTYYRKAKKKFIYRLYLFLEKDKTIIGYGALKLKDNMLYETICVGEAYRGQGHGNEILATLIMIARQEKRDLLAEIWATNSCSICLHEKAGFVFEDSKIKDGHELKTYHSE